MSKKASTSKGKRESIARKKREQERKEQDALRAKKRLELRSKIEQRKKEKAMPTTPNTAKTQHELAREKRKKILEYKKQQSRYKLPKISVDDSIQDIKKKVDINELNEQWNDEFNDDKKTDDNTEYNKDNDKTNDTDNKDKSTENTDYNKDKNDSNVDDKKANNDDNNNNDDDSYSIASFGSVEELVLSPAAEETMVKLEEDFEENDPDYFGFIEWDVFLKILKQNGVEILKKDEQMFAKATQMIEGEGVNYLGFMSRVRSNGTNINGDVSDICKKLIEQTESGILHDMNENYAQELLIMNKAKDVALDILIKNKDKVIKQDKKKAKKDKKNKDNKNNKKDIDKPKKYKKPGLHRSQSIANLKPENPLKHLVDDLALEGADVDFALLKVALAMINEKPNDNDLNYIINYLCQDGTGFVDFTYFITFLQDASKTPPEKFKNIAKIITKVANNLRVMQRAEKRRIEQEKKLKERLKKRRSTANIKTKDLDLQAKKERAKALRKKMKNYK